MAKPVKKPDPAVFDSEDQIRRDDAIIGAYLLENPCEQRVPNARGHSHEELLRFWHSSPEGQKWYDCMMRQLKPKMIEIRDRILSEGD